MPKYIPYNYNQHSMVVINFEEQIQTGTFEHAIHFLLEQTRAKIRRQIQYHITEHRRLDKNESRADERHPRTEQTIHTLTNAHEKSIGF